MDGSNIWECSPDRSTITPKQAVWLLLILITVGAIVGALGSHTIPLGYGVTLGPWFGVTVQNLGGIWFGMWGVVAAAIFPIISNSVAGASVWISLAYIPANAFQAFAPAWAFRRTKANPSLHNIKDWWVLIISTMIGNIGGSLWAVLVVLQPSGLLEGKSVFSYLIGWFLGNEVASLVGNIIVLKLLSDLMIQRQYFIRGWWR